MIFAKTIDRIEAIISQHAPWAKKVKWILIVKDLLSEEEYQNQESF